MSNLLAIRRPLQTGQHKRLREHIPRLNHVLDNLQPKWRPLGKAGVSLVEGREFRLAANKIGSRLSGVNLYTLADTLNEQVIPKMPTESNPQKFDVVGVDFIGIGRFPSIAYVLDAEVLQSERMRFTHLADKMSGFNHRWGAFTPHVSIATIDRINAEQRVLDAFAEISPESISLGAVRAVTEQSK